MIVMVIVICTCHNDHGHNGHYQNYAQHNDNTFAQIGHGVSKFFASFHAFDIDFYREGCFIVNFNFLCDQDFIFGENLKDKRSWIQVIEGDVSVDGESLGPGDGAAIEHQSLVRLQAESDVQALLFDLPS